ALAAIVPGDTITQYWSPNLIARLRGVWGGYGSALWVACGIAAAACGPRWRWARGRGGRGNGFGPRRGAPFPRTPGRVARPRSAAPRTGSRRAGARARPVRYPRGTSGPARGGWRRSWM